MQGSKDMNRWAGKRRCAMAAVHCLAGMTSVDFGEVAAGQPCLQRKFLV